MQHVFVWTFDGIVSAVVLGGIVVAACVISVYRWVEQAKCKHDKGVAETQARDAICHKCGRNLGFIGTYRDKHK